MKGLSDKAIETIASTLIALAVIFAFVYVLTHESNCDCPPASAVIQQQ